MMDVSCPSFLRGLDGIYNVTDNIYMWVSDACQSNLEVRDEAEAKAEKRRERLSEKKKSR